MTKEEKKEYNAAYHRSHPRDKEVVKANGKAWAAANPERVRAKSAAWRRANPEKMRAAVVA